MPIQQIGGLFVPVSNLERSIQFYTEILGLVCRGIEDWETATEGLRFSATLIPIMQHC